MVDGEHEFMTTKHSEEASSGYLLLKKKNGSMDYAWIEDGSIHLLPLEIRQRYIRKIELNWFT
jgi:Asp-tRNA(Asn)/Glu-tRNA(Gln) amidotransferase B subunit